MVRRMFIILIALGTMILSAADFSGYVQNWTAMKTGDSNEILLNRNRFRLNYENSSEFARAYSSIDFTSFGTNSTDGLGMNIRELYVDLYLRNWDFRIGKQQVVWGKADGAFVNDIVNPLDLSFFLLQDFEDIRMGNSMIKVNGYFGSHRLEAFWMPKFSPWKFAEPGSPWGPPSGMKIGAFDVIREKPELPDNTLGNSEWGMKFSTFILGTDISLLYLDAFQDRPVYKLAAPIDPEFGKIKLLPYFERSPMFGMNFSRPVGSVLIRGESAIFKNSAFNVQAAPPVFMGAETSDYLQGVLGIDLSGPLGANVSFQYLKRQIVDFKPTMAGVSETETWITGLISGSFWNENGNARILTMLDQGNEAGLIYASFTYKLSDMFKAESGFVGIWGGSSDTSSQFNFGMFEKNDLVYLKLTYSY